MNATPKILVAEDNDVSRDMMIGVLQTQGYEMIPARDGQEAIDIVQKDDIDLALVDINMAPRGGFEFIRHLVVNGIKLTTVVITSDDSSDILVTASDLGVRQVLQKPVKPERLKQVVARILKQQGLSTPMLATETHDTRHSPEDLMKRAVELAEQNVKSGKGGPFGAVVANAEGEILGEGVNGISSRADPIAHAEVMAIRQAAEKLRRTDLEDCVLYCSSMPTMMGKALIISVGITQVYYGLTHDDVKALRAKDEKVRDELEKGMRSVVTYEQLGEDIAMDMFNAARKDT